MKSLQLLTKGELTSAISVNIQQIINESVLQLLKDQLHWTPDQTQVADVILRISNIMYNNTSKTVLPLDDGIYDQLLVAYRRYDTNYQVGAQPITFPEMNDEETIMGGKRLLYHTVTDKVMDSKLYIRDIWKQQTPMSEGIRPRRLYSVVREPITKRLINTPHVYPELVGTLDKCKFVLNVDAQAAGVFEDPNVQVFERDFIYPCLQTGIINPAERFTMIGELKYDGVSVEAEIVGDRIVKALSRGDTGDNIATDLTPIFGGYRFRATALTEMMYGLSFSNYHVPVDKFGIKFEAVLTRRNLEILSEVRGKEYKNGRNAIIGLLGASDAYRYADYITLIPIACSVDNNDRIAELEFLNHYYHSGEYNRYCVFNGNYIEILYQVKQFTESAELIRGILPYMIDGVVISFTDPRKKQLLGRINSVNKWQMAIKFNAKQARTIFLGYTFSMGKSGTIIPMAHFKPVEFIGTIHTKQTIHSFQRFKELALVKGQEIDVQYTNDVLTYINKPITRYNQQLQQTGTQEPFVKSCPYCGAAIEISSTKKTARCINPYCHERQIMRMVDMISNLGFKDISEETIRALDITNFKKLLNCEYDDRLADKIGPLTAEKLVRYIKNLHEQPIEDFSIMTALCFEGMGPEKWKLVFSNYSLPTLFRYNRDQIMNCLNEIKGIGPMMIQSILEGFSIYKEDVQYVLQNLKIQDSRRLVRMPKVVLTGMRDDRLIKAIQKLGYDCNDKYNVTKDTALLICSSLNSNSEKMQRARRYGIPIKELSDFLEEFRIKL